uniref:Uncharacterized protein n=1 Tax=Oryza rufipogon TaxID=4529 RepID=A0A0E0QKQ8_ORYRU
MEAEGDAVERQQQLLVRWSASLRRREASLTTSPPPPPPPCWCCPAAAARGSRRWFHHSAHPHTQMPSSAVAVGSSSGVAGHPALVDGGYGRGRMVDGRAFSSHYPLKKRK